MQWFKSTSFRHEKGDNMTKIFKYDLGTLTAGKRTIMLPIGAYFPMTFLNLENRPTIYVEVDPSTHEEPQDFYIAYTGWEPPDGGGYIGTDIFKDDDGSPLILHCYMAIEE